MKKLEDMTAEELRTELKKEKDTTTRLEADKKAAEDRARAVEDAGREHGSGEPTDAQWLALEKRFGMDRDEIKRGWEFHRQLSAPLYAKIAQHEVKSAAEANVETLLDKAKAGDSQYPKYAAHVKEFLADVSASDLADPAKAEKLVDRAINFGRGKARTMGGDNPGGRIEDEGSRGDGKGTETPDEHWGAVKAEFAPLSFNLEKRVPDEYRAMHKHPDPAQKGAVQINETQEWKNQIPVRPAVGAGK